jgi:hypothetical protein
MMPANPPEWLISNNNHQPPISIEMAFLELLTEGL